MKTIMKNLLACACVLFAAPTLFGMQQDEDLKNQLMKAIRDHDIAEIDALVAAGVVVNRLDEHGMTPLKRLVYTAGSESMLLLLERYKADPNIGLPLFVAAESVDTDKVCLLIAYGADTEAVFTKRFRMQGVRALSRAASLRGSGSDDNVRALLEEGADGDH